MTSIPVITVRVCQRRLNDLTAEMANTVCFQMNLLNEVDTLLQITPVKTMRTSDNRSVGGNWSIKQCKLVTAWEKVVLQYFPSSCTKGLSNSHCNTDGSRHSQRKCHNTSTTVETNSGEETWWHLFLYFPLPVLFTSFSMSVHLTYMLSLDNKLTNRKTVILLPHRSWQCCYLFCFPSRKSLFNFFSIKVSYFFQISSPSKK